MSLKIRLGFAAVAVASAAYAASPIDARYATDAYPGFDSEENIIEGARKEPGFFSWWSGPKKGNPADQLKYARAEEADGDYGDARDAYDALVAEWPSSDEAATAQEALADMLFVKERDYIDAFKEYRYLLDFYPSRCNYDAVAARMYETAKLMRRDGKRVVFFRFANTTDVRRAFESVVLHAPGAVFAPEALLTIAELREEEGYPEKAIQVLENLRNTFPGTSEAKSALRREAGLRMNVLRSHAYNRSRCLDTAGFMRMALQSNPDPDFRADLERWQSEVLALVEDEAFAAAKFYDSRTRTKQSAVAAYERFLGEYPASVHADEARARLLELKSPAREEVK